VNRLLSLTVAAALTLAGALVAGPAYATDYPDPLPLDPLPGISAELCAPGTVPGWLNEKGEPTSCVSNHPCPGFDANACPPADPMPAVVIEVDESLAYLYEKVNPAAPASFSNSGTQTLVAQEFGHGVATVTLENIGDACGDGWAVQLDDITHDGTFVAPTTITAPDTPLSSAGVLVRWSHADLSTVIDVPECVDPPVVVDPPADPLPIVVPDTTPGALIPPSVITSNPDLPDTLAQTGLADDAGLIPLGIGAGIAALLGILLATVGRIVEVSRRRADAAHDEHLQAISDGRVNPFA